MRSMNAYRPILTQHRLRRLVLWALAMLHWIGAVLSGNRPIGRRHLNQRGDVSLSGLTRMVTALLIVRALNLHARSYGRVSSWRHGRDLRRAHFRRSLLGAKLRHALQDKTPAAHIAKLVRILRNLDAFAVALLRRLHRLRRYFLRTTPPVAPPALIFAAPGPANVLADTS
jgi:hypothetical protein